MFIGISSLKTQAQQCPQECILNIEVDIPDTTPIIPGGGGTPGAAIAVPTGVAAAGGAAAFSPLLLAGLEPGAILGAAAPIGCVGNKCCFLQKAMKSHFKTNSLANATNQARTTMTKSYFVVNDTDILNGTFNIQDINIPTKFLNAPKIKFEATIASQSFAEVNGKPELELRIFKDIPKQKLEKRFTSQGFRRNFLMKKYEIPYSSSTKNFANGIHKVNGVIETSKIKNSAEPIRTVMTYMDGGFSKGMAVNNPRAITYAYLIEFTAVN